MHNGTESVNRLRKLPRGTSTSYTIVKVPFLSFTQQPRCKSSYEIIRLLPVPGMVDDYNHFMGGVDIADQLRSGFTTQRRGVKYWRPLFHWLLDTTIINEFVLFRSVHRAFVEALVKALDACT